WATGPATGAGRRQPLRRYAVGRGREAARHSTPGRVCERVPEDVHRLGRLRRNRELVTRAVVAYDDAQRVALAAPVQRDVDTGALAGGELFDVSCCRHDGLDGTTSRAACRSARRRTERHGLDRALRGALLPL